MGIPKPPVERTCPRSLWELETKPCLVRLLNDDVLERVCPGDLNYPKDIVGQTLDGYNCERSYQDTLIRECKKWRR